MQHIFKCVNCGEYPVDPTTLLASINPELQEKLRTKLRENEKQGNIASIVLSFADDCPRCNPITKEREVTLSVRKGKPES